MKVIQHCHAFDERHLKSIEFVSKHENGLSLPSSYEVVGKVPFGKQCEVYFKDVTPLGFYAAWALFSVSQHMLVWMASEIIYLGRRFSAKEILDDDVVIENERVAKEYQTLIEDLEVSILKSKSLISENGSLEFAK
ncbi:hypothetical protein HPP92_006535 [Vanilla planifolia]|uniref:Uncharacterized protein n=1 Tax=Vanilla planifolia TaxID=51239 RepID=A0A835RW49_VANPL|nr:hypothetical protein HPP92_006535 [Vanilla planifolia]